MRSISLRPILASLFLVGAVGWLLWYVTPIYRARPVTPVIEKVVASLNTDDIQALNSLVADAEVIKHLLAVRQYVPEIFEIAGEGIRPAHVKPLKDRLHVSYRLKLPYGPVACRMLNTTFLRTNGEWRLLRVFLEHDMCYGVMGPRNYFQEHLGELTQLCLEQHITSLRPAREPRTPQDLDHWLETLVDRKSWRFLLRDQKIEFAVTTLVWCNPDDQVLRTLVKILGPYAGEIVDFLQTLPDSFLTRSLFLNEAGVEQFRRRAALMKSTASPEQR